jgi:hypothetical protein
MFRIVRQTPSLRLDTAPSRMGRTPVCPRRLAVPPRRERPLMVGQDTMTFAAFTLHVVPRLEREARMARAELRALEQKTGQTADQHGAYWLARTAAMETLTEAARQALRTGDLSLLAQPLRVVQSIPAPACNVADHAEQLAA